MKEKLILLAKYVRAFIVRLLLKPKSKYKLYPISSIYGFDRGKPIDRYYIEQFLEKSKAKIRGSVLEVTDNKYTREFGGKRVEQSDVLDINNKNKIANIISDLRNLSEIKDNSYDAIILTHVIGLIDDFDSVVLEIYRVLKPGGSVIVTAAAYNMVSELTQNYWRFTEASLKYIFLKQFKKAKLQVDSYGNVLIAQAFLVGMALEDVNKRDLEFVDKRYPVVISLIAQK